MKTEQTNTARLWLSPEQLAEIEHERKREEYEREQIATAQSEDQFEAIAAAYLTRPTV